ncbi:MAG: hypothetical protein AAGA58_14320 [Verrucomicrobiota bacterium]
MAESDSQEDKLPRDLVLDDKWDTSQLRRLVDARCASGRKPTHLFLGRKEAKLLRDHLSQAFGEEEVSKLDHLWYMGLRVFELDIDTFARVAGDKFMKQIDDDPEKLKRWKAADFAGWQLKFG